jgi:threonine aldolase
MLPMNFASDNTAAVAPEIMAALVAGNEGFAPGYGGDDIMRAVERCSSKIFGCECPLLTLPTGTATNATGPEFFGSGIKHVALSSGIAGSCRRQSQPGPLRKLLDHLFSADQQ